MHISKCVENRLSGPVIDPVFHVFTASVLNHIRCGVCHFPCCTANQSSNPQMYQSAHFRCPACMKSGDLSAEKACKLPYTIMSTHSHQPLHLTDPKPDPDTCPNTPLSSSTTPRACPSPQFYCLSCSPPRQTRKSHPPSVSSRVCAPPR